MTDLGIILNMLGYVYVHYNCKKKNDKLRALLSYADLETDKQNKSVIKML